MPHDFDDLQGDHVITPSQSAREPRHDNEFYRQILKSSALIGGSTALNILIGIVRAKIMATLLDPAGFGLMGLYSSMTDLAVAIAGMGVGNSGVRQIAEAAASNNATSVARTATVLRRTVAILGLLGAGSLLLFSHFASLITFNDVEHTWAVAILSLSVFFRVVVAGQGALLQGLRRISDLAKVNIISALVGTILSLLLVYFLGANGLAPALVCIAAATFLTSWWYARKTGVQSCALSPLEMRDEAISILKLGFAFMASGLLVAGAAYATRLIVARELGLDAAGLYSSAWTLGGLYVGYVIQAMGTDFYPQLVGVANDHPRSNRLVNDQVQIGLLLAGPGVIATLTLAPAVITLFYSAKFGGSAEALRWICIGVALRVITWPLGYILVAKNRQVLFLGVDFAWTVVNCTSTYFCVKYFGLAGAGIAFFISYLFHGIYLYPIVRKLTGFKWSPDNVRTGGLILSATAVAFFGTWLLPGLWATALGAALTLLTGLYALQKLLALLSTQHLPKKVVKLLVLLRLAPRDS